MPYLIETTDNANGSAIRQAQRPAHLQFLRDNATLLLACGAKLNSQGQTTGTLYLLNVETEQEALHFLSQDPYSKADLAAEVRTSYWRVAVLDGKARV